MTWKKSQDRNHATAYQEPSSVNKSLAMKVMTSDYSSHNELIDIQEMDQ